MSCKFVRVSGLKQQTPGFLLRFPISDLGFLQAILSGPAGGVVGYALTTFGVETEQPVRDRAFTGVLYKRLETFPCYGELPNALRDRLTLWVSLFV